VKILGTGIDIVETKRIAESLERFGDRFLKRVFLDGEVAYAQSMKFPHLHLAARFAAKEAISKAFGTGIGHEMGWRDLEIVREPGGAPRVVLHGKAEAHAKARGVKEIHVSLSHTTEYGAASALLIGSPAEGNYASP
jgi:holo-[acyl-carrier protein] synthase